MKKGPQKEKKKEKEKEKEKPKEKLKEKKSSGSSFFGRFFGSKKTTSSENLKATSELLILENSPLTPECDISSKIVHDPITGGTRYVAVHEDPVSLDQDNEPMYVLISRLRLATPLLNFMINSPDRLSDFYKNSTNPEDTKIIHAQNLTKDLATSIIKFQKDFQNLLSEMMTKLNHETNNHDLKIFLNNNPELLNFTQSILNNIENIGPFLINFIKIENRYQLSQQLLSIYDLLFLSSLKDTDPDKQIFLEWIESLSPVLKNKLQDFSLQLDACLQDDVVLKKFTKAIQDLKNTQGESYRFLLSFTEKKEIKDLSEKTIGKSLQNELLSQHKDPITKKYPDEKQTIVILSGAVLPNQAQKQYQQIQMRDSLLKIESIFTRFMPTLQEAKEDFTLFKKHENNAPKKKN